MPEGADELSRKEHAAIPNPVEKLHPVDFVDADGAQRELFTFEDKTGHKVKVVFYTREELPFPKK